MAGQSGSDLLSSPYWYSAGEARREWVHSVAAPHELPALLARIYLIEMESDNPANALPLTDKAVSDNDDMMILVVDDHPINRRLLADQLGSLGYQCKTANDGVDALNVLSKNHIDIVLSDVNMPNMDGYRLTQRIRQLGLTLPVIGVTANALAEEKQRCLESGMDSCLSKPVTLDVIKQTLTVYAERVRKSGIVGRIRRLRRIWHSVQMPDAALTRLIWPTGD